MATKILLLNSDLAKNRGDRAIAEGIIQLAKAKFPGAELTGISEYAARDKAWFGIDFIDMDFQSLKPWDFMRLWRAAHRADIVLWGGGEILKDYTNKLALWYWAVKLSYLRTANRNIYGAYQGVGPTRAASSRRIIRRVVKHCRKFIVRDAESRDKLIGWGVPAAKIIASSDPAILPQPSKLSADTLATLAKSNHIDQQFLDNFVCIGPRSWFHYKTGGLVPFRYKRALLRLVGQSLTADNPKYRLYQQRLLHMVDNIIETHHTNVLLVPMHMGESDSELCRYLQANAKQPESIRLLDSDDLSPGELRAVMARTKAMIGFRLHSTIVAASAGVPCINLYYVDKGRVFFDQIGQGHYALPIERVLDDSFPADFADLFAQLYAQRKSVSQTVDAQVNRLRRSVQAAFDEAL